MAYATYPPTPSTPGGSLAAVTPSDTVDLPGGIAKALWIGAAGAVAIIAENDTVAVTLAGAAAGQLIPIRTKRVKATGTTATSIVALF